MFRRASWPARHGVAHQASLDEEVLMVRRTRAALALTAVAGVAAVGLAGCGGDDDSGAAPATTEAPAATTTAPATTAAAPASASVKVDADPSGQLAFVQKSLTAPTGADVFVFTNDSSVPHNLAIEGNGVAAGPTATIMGGDTAQLKVTLKPGTYEFFCAVPGHRQAGMEGTLTVQ
jgi:uncharacterized cupredoxin-like copper-binding protein